MTPLKVGIFGDAGNSMTNGTTFYYTPGLYERYSLGASGPMQKAVADMMRNWGVTELVQLGDSSYDVNSSTLLDFNIGQYYNDYMQPYGNKPREFAYADSKSIYGNGNIGGVLAVRGKKQWPYNLYDFPNGFPNPAHGGKGGSRDGINHYWLVPGNHDEATVLGTYTDGNVNQINRKKQYNGAPVGPDVFDFKNNINVKPAPPGNADFVAGKMSRKVGSNQQLLDYHPYFLTANRSVNPSYLKPGQVRVGRADPNGYGIYSSVDLGETVVAGRRRPLLHVVMIDTPRLMTDAGYYDFNFDSTGRKKGDPTLKNFKFDPTVPHPSPGALFQSPTAKPDDPTIAYQMFDWVRQDLAQSKAVWTIVAGHHPAYHVGNTSDAANDGYYNSPVMVKFLAALKDAAGNPLFDAYFNGHSHAYGRVLEMAGSSRGIGPGIPFVTTGNGGRFPDDLNQVPYGASVLAPQNWSNTFVNSEGQEVSNAENNGLTQEYLDALPVASRPTTVGLSGHYRYTTNNYPQGWNVGRDGVYPNLRTIEALPSHAGSVKGPSTTKFKLFDSVYNSILRGTAESKADVSGLYGYGSGAAYVEVDQGYFFTNYRTAHPLDPAILLIGRSQGLGEAAMQRGSLFYEQWSPATARLDDLALFSFDVVFDADAPDGRLDHLQLVQQGQGYLESSVGSTAYGSGTYTFEILGNNPSNPLGFDHSDPSRAAVELTFSNGRLAGLAFAKDRAGKERKGSGYAQLANAINENNFNTDSTKSLLVALNINLEAQQTLADQAPGHELYQDWYLISDTALSASAVGQGPFGAVAVNLQPRSSRARQIIATQPLTTGYSGTAPQAAYATPQRGSLQVRDALGNTVGGGSDLTFNNGSIQLSLQRRPAPGPLALNFGGDPYSSYLVNHKPTSAPFTVSYGSWMSPLKAGLGHSLVLAASQSLTVTRTDATPGALDIGLLPASRSRSAWPGTRSKSTHQRLLVAAQPASAKALSTERIFTPAGAGSWFSAQGQAQGSSTTTDLPAGIWRPIAYDSKGRVHMATSVKLAGNTAAVTFEGGFSARFSAPGTGSAPKPEGVGSLALTLQRGSHQANGLALFEADPITGLILTPTGQPLLPGDAKYLQAAFERASGAGLVLTPDRLPAVGQESVITDLPLQPGKNYGLLLLRNNDPSDLVSSYARANPQRQVAMQSFAAPGRGVIFGIEEQPLGSPAVRDYADLIVSISTTSFRIS